MITFEQTIERLLSEAGAESYAHFRRQRKHDGERWQVSVFGLDVDGRKTLYAAGTARTLADALTIAMLSKADAR